MREYTIYAVEPGFDFTARSAAYSRGTHRWIYKVFAASIRQAYAMAYKDRYATDPRGPGIRTLESDWWHGCADSPEDAIAQGLRVEAPYLRKAA